MKEWKYFIVFLDSNLEQGILINKFHERFQE